VGLDHADNDVGPLGLSPPRRAEHFERLADPRRHAKKHAQLPAILTLRIREQGFRIRASRIVGEGQPGFRQNVCVMPIYTYAFGMSGWGKFEAGSLVTV
jgi:hypothetical protein